MNETAATRDISGLAPEQQSMLERAQQGFHCSEILLFAGLEAQGKTNPEVVRTVSALAGGMGFSGEVCGALTGGVCLFGLYAGRGAVEEIEHPNMKLMIHELMDWFSQKYGESYGGIRCRDITEDDPNIAPTRCPRIVAAVHKKVKSILGDNGLIWDGLRQTGQ